jgi:hypothetical protein
METRMAYVVKAAPARNPAARSLSFNEKTMYRGKAVQVGADIFIFAAEHQGGRGLVARGVVTAVAAGPGSRVSIKVRPTAAARRPLGRRELKPYCDLEDPRPQAEIACKLYRQATNKIAGISDRAAAFLRKQF